MTVRRFSFPFVAALLLVVSTQAEFSPLSIHPEGNGMPLSETGARERGMGDAGMAAISSKGFFLPNVSRSAYFDRTSFTATLEADEDWLHDDASSNHTMTLSLPTIATFIKTSKLGTIGAYYQQSYLRNFSVLVDGNVQQEYDAEGGTYLLGLSWAYSPMPLFALGVSENIVLQRDRFIQPATFNGDPQLPNSENLQDTSLEASGWGSYPTFSGTLHLHRLDMALSFTPSVDLDITRERRITNILSDSLSDTTRALPMKVALGAAWRASSRQTYAFDLYYEDWNGGGVLNPAYKTAFGYEFRGLDNPFEEYRRRLTYRAGLGFDQLYLREVKEFYGTLGIGLPLGRRGHVMDISLKYGHRSYDGDTFFAEDYVKLSASIIGVGIWGQPARKRR